MSGLRTHLAAFLAATALLSGCGRAGPAVTPSPVGERGYVVSGYHPYWAEDDWRTYPFDVLDRIYVFEIEIGADGRVSDAHGWPERWAPLVARAREAGVQVVPTVSMHDANAFVTLFQDAQAISRLVEELAELVQTTPGLAGLHVDFEVFRPVDLPVRDGFTAFFAALDRRLGRIDPSLTLSIFALAFDDDDVYNERALAEVADYVVLQGYDFHSENDVEAGPVAALTGWGRLNWGTVVDRFLGLGVPASKLVMAVPLYGYEWPAESDVPGAQTQGPGVAIPLTAQPDVLPHLPRARAQSTRYGVRRDEQSGSPYYAFHDGVSWRQGWFDDDESLEAKYRFVKERGLAGVALFPLAYGDGPVWEDLRAAFEDPRE